MRHKAKRKEEERLKKKEIVEIVQSPDFEEKFEEYLNRIFNIHPVYNTEQYDGFDIEYFGVLSLTDVRQPHRKLWYIYYSHLKKIDETVDRIHAKYGKKNMYELFRKPVFSGPDFRASVKVHFADAKWYVKGNLLEAPPQSNYNDERLVKEMTDLYKFEMHKLYTFILKKLNRDETWLRY